MKNYFYIDRNGQQSGPISEDSLKQHGVVADTLVWCVGMSEWKKANEIAELKYLCNISVSSLILIEIICFESLSHIFRFPVPTTVCLPEKSLEKF